MSIPAGPAVGLASTGLDWTTLTRSSMKAGLYEREPYFREGLTDAREVWGGDFDEILHRSALFMVKPEGRISDNNVLEVVREFLDQLGMRIIAARDVWLDRLMWREVWRYQVTAATLDRLAVSDEWLKLGAALLLGVRAGIPGDRPATIRLTAAKGSANLAEQRPHTLRSRLRQPNRMLSFIHVADEPADLLRELAILLPRPERRDMLRRYLNENLAPEESRVLAEAESVPKRSLDPAAALERVEAAVLAAARADGVPPILRSALAQMRAGGRIHWGDFVSALEPYRSSIDQWDLVVLGTTHIEYDEPGRSKLLVNPDPDSW